MLYTTTNKMTPEIYNKKIAIFITFFEERTKKKEAIIKIYISQKTPSVRNLNTFLYTKS